MYIPILQWKINVYRYVMKYMHILYNRVHFKWTLEKMQHHVHFLQTKVLNPALCSSYKFMS